MKKFTKILLGASLLSVLFAGCANGGLIANDTLDSPDIKAKVTENGVILLKWDEVKDASFYSVYSKAPGQQDWASVSGKTTDNWYVTKVNKTDAEYEFKVVASSMEKMNLLSSESEVTVETPEAWVDTAAFAASDIKLTLVPNTLNKYELTFPVDAGFNYTAMLVKDTVAAETNAADLFVQTASYENNWTETRYYSSSTGNDLSYDEYENLGNRVRSAMTTFTTEISAETDFMTYVNNNATDVSTAMDDLELGDNRGIYSVISAAFNDTDKVNYYKGLVDDYVDLYTEYTSYASYTQNHNDSGTNGLNRGWINQANGYAFTEELDDDDNVVAPVFSDNVVVGDDGAEYRVVVKMAPINSEVAKTKYILSSATIKFDSTGIVSAPEDCAVTAKNATTKVLTFTANKYKGTEMAASNYRIYQLLTTTTKNSDLVYTGTTKVLTALGSPAKDTDLVTTRLNYVQYKLEASVKEPPASGIESYTYEFFVAYTNQNGNVSWYKF